MTEDEVYRTAIRTFYDFPTADFETQLRDVLHVAREQVLREAAEAAQNCHFRSSRAHIVAAIEALISKETPDDN